MNAPANVDLHLTRTRDGKWKCRLACSTLEITTSAYSTAWEAVSAALSRLGEEAMGVPVMPRERETAGGES